MNKNTHVYHHMGIPTQTPRPGEKYSSKFKMYTSDGKDKNFRIQWHRFDPGCPLHQLLQTTPHIAFKVDCIDTAIKNKNVLLEPYYPFKGFRVAVIEEEGVPVELIETNLTEEEVWADPHENSVIYPTENGNK